MTALFILSCCISVCASSHKVVIGEKEKLTDNTAMVDSVSHFEPRVPQLEVHQQSVSTHVLHIVPLELLAEDLYNGCHVTFKQYPSYRELYS